MFATSDFRPPAAPPPPLNQNRAIGVTALILCLIVIGGLSFWADQQVFIPFAPTYAITQTAAVEQSSTPRSPTPTGEKSRIPLFPTETPRPSYLPTFTPLPGDQVKAGKG